MGRVAIAVLGVMQPAQKIKMAIIQVMKSVLVQTVVILLLEGVQ